MKLKMAKKGNFKLRMAIYGPSGSGKTMTALEIASILGEKIAVIDSENGSSAMYAFNGENGYIFAQYILKEYSPKNYVEAIEECEKAGADVIIIDSLSHAWDGLGGTLQLARELTKKPGSGGALQAWGQVTPLQNQLLFKILQNKVHIIATMRTKPEIITEKNESGKTIVKKVGTVPIQKPGIEYEFDIVLSLDNEHLAFVEKTRCAKLDGRIIHIPDQQFYDDLLDWLTPQDDGGSDNELWGKSKQEIPVSSATKIENVVSPPKLNPPEKQEGKQQKLTTSVSFSDLSPQLENLLLRFGDYCEKRNISIDRKYELYEKAIQHFQVELLNSITDINALRKFLYDEVKKIK